MRVLSGLEIVPIRGLLALDCIYRINFDTEDGVGWFPYNIIDSVVFRIPAYEGVDRGRSLTLEEVRVTY